MNPSSDAFMNWNHSQADRYVDTIAAKIPGYYLLYDMTARLMAAQLPLLHQPPEVLIVGAGGGQELVTLGSRHPDWKLTGVDPSDRMLEAAKQRLDSTSLGQQVTLFHGSIDQLPQPLHYDAATCLLVLHFVQGLSEKAALLNSLYQRLKPGAPLFIASINGNPTTESFAIMMQAWKAHMLANGVPVEDWERFAASFGQEFDPVPDALMLTLLREAGFREPTSYYGAYLIDAWFAIKG
ncbi:class I SAM-dependent methyltransferase [Paenibacillus sp. ACRRX]|uniref:class I SAM-dependent methyltransferase n=1 Tax=unclassified Paenibacillus TaxID=185978 RepID=UPI001EF4D792|nr:MULTISPECIES: class I SAM-dependent methyltransferase [unclassified Paenibacillus]MCG7408261.1 class I SAM-dependent methyltransferase [Paenibacillus sp. ACRRX]MDK8181354.1 class I SAM-dependent methyltransferase [Paenibacillus sp. UMB4589-SE434]